MHASKSLSGQENFCLPSPPSLLEAVTHHLQNLCGPVHVYIEGASVGVVFVPTLCKTKVSIEGFYKHLVNFRIDAGIYMQMGLNYV